MAEEKIEERDGTTVTIDREEDAALMQALDKDSPEKGSEAEKQTPPEQTTETVTEAPKSTSDTVTEAPKPTETKETVTEAAKPEPKPEPKPALSADDLKSVIEKMPTAVAEAVKAATAPPKEEPKPAPFQPYRPSPELVEKIFQGGEEAIKAVGEMLDKTTLQSVQLVASILVPQYEARLNAMQEHLVYQAREQARQEFVAKYPQFTDYLDAAEEYANKLLAGNPNITKKELFPQVAEGLTRILAEQGTKLQGYQQRVAPRSAAPEPPALPGAKARPVSNTGKVPTSTKSEDQELMEELERRRNR